MLCIHTRSRTPAQEAHAQDPVSGASLALVMATLASDSDTNAGPVVPRPWETVALPPTHPPVPRPSPPGESLR
jgi:hypothetical protein